ncbi:MAG: amino acid adenylation domain-containing protein [Cyanobacteria bacterium P01_H01_bin.21]
MNVTLRQCLDLESSDAAQALLRDSLRQQIAQIAGIELSQIDDQQPLSYFGFDSLMATELRTYLLNELTVDISLDVILEGATVASLLQACLQQPMTPNPQQPLETLSEGKSHSEPAPGRYPLSQGQWGLWFLYKLEPESAAYNLAFTARVRSDLDVAVLEQAVQILVARHPSLRTVYGQDTGEPFQEIHAAQTSCLLEQIDATGWDEERLVQGAIAAYQRPFNLETGPILRLTILTRSPQDHVLLLTIHHIAVDGVSFGILLKELQQLYKAQQTGESLKFAPIDAAYPEFVQWQRDLVKSESGETLWTYWQQQLAGVQTLDLPTDHTYTPSQSQRGASRGASYSFEISPALTQQLRSLARAHGATLYTTLLTVFQVLLHRYTGQTDIVVGTPASGRGQPQFARTVGFFVNMIALRGNLAGNPTFSALLEQVRQTVLAALAHQAYPAPVLVERLGLNRDLSQPSLFRSAFNVLNLPKLAGDFELSVSNQIGARAQWGNLVLEPFEIPQQEGQNDLVFDIMETSDRLIGIFRYSCDLFEIHTIDAMAEHFQTLLDGIVANPDETIAQLPFLSLLDQQRLLQWATPTAPYPTGLAVHQLIEHQAERTPDAIAIVCPQLTENLDISYQKLTYQQLNTQANQLARYLQIQGVCTEVRVGIYLLRSPLLFVAVLAVLKAGGTYVPLDPNYPAERLAFMLSDAQIGLLLTDSSLLATLPSNIPQLCLDQLKLGSQNRDNVPVTVASEQLAYIVYTSGSTGRAKGVMIEHRSWVNAYFAWEDVYQLPKLSSHLQMASFSFDVFAGDFIRALGSGAKLVVCPQEWLLEPEPLYGLMKDQAVDSAEFGPAVVRTLMQYLHQTSQQLNFMRLLIVGSDAFYVQEYQQLKRLCAPNTRLINSYGVSEATIDSSYFETPSFEGPSFEGPFLELESDGMVPIGRPFPNTQLWVLDEHLQPVPEGVTGKLYIGGAGLSRGYLNRPELTQEKFIAIPGADSSPPLPPVLYKTGDLARYLSDGNIEYLGRSDSQIKLRGLRIELGEIEATLAQHPSVGQAVVIVRKDKLGIKSLVAYAVCNPQQTVSPAELRAFLSQTLPAPMLPSGFVLLETFPLNANGKVDRQALPIPKVFERSIEAGAVAPRSWIEKQLAEIWMALLRLDSVGIYDNFFELGGHSLLATQAIAQMRQVFQAELPLRLLFDRPTIAQLGEQIEAVCQQRFSSLPTIVPASNTDTLPLSYAQESLWFLNQLEGIGPTYNMPMPLRLQGQLNIAALEHSLTALRERHTVLRTVFPTRQTQPIQVINAEAQLALPVVDVSALPEQDLETLIFDAVKETFDLASGPLMQSVLLRRDPQDHVLVITLHHIVADGWSIDIFARELGELYSAFIEDRSPTLPELPIQYGDFACWQRQYLQGAVLDTMLAHWQRTLAGAPPTLALPTDYARPPVQTFRGQSARFYVDTELSEGLKALAQTTKVTLFMLLLAVFQILLRGYCAQDDIVVGAPIANRNRAETAGLIGYFVNILVLRTDLSGDPTFQEVLKRVYEVTMDAYTYQDLPFEKLVEVLQPERSLSHTPLFQVMFVLQNAPTPELLLPDLTIQALETNIITSKFDLTLALREGTAGLEGFVEYNTDLFKPETIERLMGHYQQLLKQVVANPEYPLSALGLLTPQEQTQLLQWQPPLPNSPQGVCIHQLVEAQANRTPEATAVVFGDQHLSYGRLNQQANQLGRFLQQHGVGPEVRIGICLEKSLELLVAMLGVLKAGGAYVPLDPNYPAERLSLMLEDAQTALILTHSDLVETLPQSEKSVVCLDRSWPKIKCEESANLESPVVENDLAYIIYTSGSTGRAKGVMIEHRSLINAYFAWQKAYELDTLSSHLQMASFSFDVFTGDWVRALCSGAQLVLCPKEYLLDPEQLYGLMRSHHIEAAEFSPLVLRQLVQHLHTAQQTLDFVKLLVVGSDSVYWQDFVTLQPLCSSETRLINSYGLSEATIDSTYFEVTLADCADTDRLVPIGYPFAGTQIHILNSNHQPVPIGVVGELYVGGAGLARGYLNQPELTQQRFLKVNTVTEAQRRFSALRSPSPVLYKTGDLARYRSDGAVELVGRSDSQIKLRGFRIELGEIESAIAQHPHVSETAVILHSVDDTHQHLVAYVALKHSGQQPPISELRTFLTDRLPSYMVPSNIVALETMPLSPNGKIDRRALPVPEVFQRYTDVGFVAPRDRIEHTVSEIWRTVLNLETVGIYDNFFDLGGHSLLATQVIAQLRQTVGVELPLRTLFEAPTIAQLAEQIEVSCQQKIQATPAITPTSRKEDLPLSYTQESLWFLNQLEGIGPTYTMPMPLRLQGQLNVLALEKSLNALSQRHTVLTTAFPTHQTQPVQVISSRSNLSLPVVDVPALSNQTLEDLIFEEAKKVFDLASGPLMRSRLLRCGSEDHVLVITLHHIVADGWSIDIFARELGEFYSAFIEDRTPDLPELPIQYADFACWQRQYLQGAVLDTMLAHWQRTLAGAPPVLALPTDYPRSPVQTFNGSSARFQVDTELSQQLQQLAQQTNVTLFMLLLAVFQILLRRYSAQDDIVVGAPVANRNRAETAGLIGYFVNILVLRTDLSGNPTFQEVLKRVYDVAMDAYTYQDLPFEKLVEVLQPERSLSHTPLFQVMFVLQNAPTPELQLPELTIQALETDIITSKFDLTLALREGDQGLEGFVEYNTDLFKPETIDRLMGHYQQLLKAVVADPNQSIAALTLLTPDEQAQQQRWQQTQTIYPQACIHQLFETQVEQTPEATAIVFAEQQLSYRQLNENANQLGHFLQTHGVGPEVRVGICLEKSLDLLVAVLGVLKAGGAYVPLDPNYPSERLSFMLADAQPKLVLTHSTLIESLPSSEATILLDTQWESIAQSPLTNLTQTAQPNNLSYIVYTSGSTGRAKGVMIEHRSLVNAYFAWQEAYELNSLSSHLQMASFSFDVFTGDWVRALCSGAQLVLCPKEYLLEPNQLYTLMQTADTAEFSPAVVRLLIQYLHQTQQNLDFMRLLVIGSDTLYAEDYRQLQAVCDSQTRVINSYGLSEATIDSTYFESPPLNLPNEGTVPIGRPFANTQLHILSTDLQPVPIGIPGELYIGGMGLARGYWNRPELTQERFVQKKREKTEEGKDDSFVLYKTGDLARYRDDGCVELLGRSDAQVKLRGFRIEIGEIEAVLTEHPAVQAGVVVLRDELAGGEQLVAYVVADNHKDQELGFQLRSFIKDHLPGYMVPAYFMVLDQLPLSPNGKVDRRALPIPVQVSKTFVAPSTPTEIRLAEIWAEILQLPQVGVDDSFFDLGGHSLLATALIFRIRQAFAVEFPLSYLFDTPTVAALAQHIESLPRVAQIAPIVQSHSTTAPLSLSQQYIWQMQQADLTDAGLNSSVVMRFNGTLEPEVVERSFNQIIQRHSILRTVFTTNEPANETIQQILPAVSFSLIYKDLQHLPIDQRETEAVRLGVDIGQRPFNLTTAPLLRAALFRLGPQVHWLLITMHHIVTDGWSFGILLQELDSLIQAEDLPEMSWQYADFARWQRQVYNKTAIAQQLTYWQQQLTPAAEQSPLAPPTSKTAHQYFTRFPAALASAVTNWSRAQGVTSFVVLLAGLKLTLAEWSQQQEILVVATVGNRTMPETERLIGCFINDVILRSHLSSGDTGLTFLQRLQTTVNEAIDHKEVPLQQVIDQVKRCRPLDLLASITMTPSVQPAMPRWEPVDLQSQTDQWQDIPTELYTIGTTETTPLEIYAELSTTIRFVVSYSTERFTRSAVEQLFNRYQTWLELLTTNPEIVLSRCSNLPFLARLPMPSTVLEDA